MEMQAECQLPTELADETSEENQADHVEAHERPTRQRRAPTLFTYDTLGTPSFHQPTVLSAPNHAAGVTPLSVPVLQGTVGGPTWLNCVWPWAYPASYGHVGVYPCWRN